MTRPMTNNSQRGTGMSLIRPHAHLTWIATVWLALCSMPLNAQERLPSADEVARIRVEQPLPGLEALEAAKDKNSADTARALSQAQRQSKTSSAAQGGGLPAITPAPGVDVQALVEKHYKNSRPSVGQKKGAPGLLYFASFAMPEASLNRIINQAERSGAALVVRGLVKGGDFKATIERMDKLLNRRPVSILIDPTLFSRFDVQRVPTIVLVSGEIPHCEEQGCASPTPPYWAVAGDVSLDYALEAITRQAPEANAIAQPYLTALRGGFHEGR